MRPDPSRRARSIPLLAVYAALAGGCAADARGDLGPEPELAAGATEDLKGCKGKASKAIPDSGQYVLTTFGGPSEPQPLACGGHSKSGSWYYAASKQRYGCGARVRIVAGGKCVVAQTDDYGPDVCVEKAAGMPVMDVSPLVSQALFGVSSLGWSDEKKVLVEVAPEGTPLGPCAAPEPPPPTGDAGGASGGGSAGGAGGAGGTGGSGTACTSDGACNPGNDGSGLICVGGQCVPGCKASWHCPGSTTCKSGQCS